MSVLSPSDRFLCDFHSDNQGSFWLNGSSYTTIYMMETLPWRRRWPGDTTTTTTKSTTPSASSSTTTTTNEKSSLQSASLYHKQPAPAATTTTTSAGVSRRSTTADSIDSTRGEY